jgi:predicted Zn-dependent protease
VERLAFRSVRRIINGASALGALVLATVILGGCASTTKPGAVGVERQQTLLVSSAEIDRAAAQSYRKIIAEAARKGLLDRNPQQVARVREIARRLIAQTGTFRPDASGWKWEVHVISSNELNAWCMPGGKIAVYTGLLDKLKLTDDELAAVMGHEIAHALREHGREQASEQLATAAAIGIVAAVLGAPSGSVDLASLVANLTISKPNSRTHETEADRIGVELAARAGYDPYAAVSLWQKMARAGGSEPPQLLSTHPSSETRTADLKVYAARVEPLYQQAKKR